MKLRDFVKENRQEIDNGIVRYYGDNCKPLNDSDRHEWILNDEGLYNCARSEGCRI